MTNSTEVQASEVSKSCIAVRLRKLNREVSAIYDGCFRPFGLTIAQFNLLIAIGAHGEVSPSRLVKALSLEKSTVSRNIVKMQAHNWVESIPQGDKRSHTLALTDAGKKMVDEVIPVWRFAQKETEKTYGPLAELLSGITFR
ncbi:MAG: winged helix-turn-helix transcriptional regulator [Sneathiella sp.]|nr:winged helix-turn-helix transcriptional regulator [Sneathiella sp.]